MIGQTISHYRIIEQLGAGGMGVVYKAEDIRLKRLVALKFLPVELTQDLEAKERLMHEAQAASALDHPHICVIYEIDEAEDGRLFVAMAYYDGETLKQRIARGQIAVGEAVDLAIQIVQAAAAAHDAGIVHRDIKPANIIITRRGEARLLDFGIATLAGQTRITRTGTTLGTVAYMAPEQISGADPDPRSDVWAIGVVLFEMLTGRLPFEGANEIALMNAIANHSPITTRRVRADVPADLESVVSRALAKDPRERFQDADALIRALLPFGSSSSTPAAHAAPPRHRTISRRALAAACIVAVAIAVPAAWKIKRGRDIRAARDTAVAEVQRLVAGNRPADALGVVLRAKDTLSGDPEIARLLRDVSVRRSLETTPSGATISIREPEPTAEWHVLGVTPLIDVQLPKDGVRWRIEKPGFEPQEFLAPAVPAVSVGWSVPASIALRPAAEADGEIGTPARDVGVELTGYDFSARIRVPEYAIDRFEVTNREFKAFVDADGYEREEFWKEPVRKDGRTLAWKDAVALFRDQTGRPGPATWEAGTYPAGQDAYPVTGVSWYEAAAYARFRGKQLPTVYHWLGAAGMFLASKIVPFSNFGGRGPLPVGRMTAVSPFGLSDVAGNVKEWCWNETAHGGTRFVLGGAWNEPEYMFLFADARSPLERAHNIGFRCARYPKPEAVPAATRAAISVGGRDYRNEKPVSEEVFRVYRSLYAYDPSPLDARIERVDDSHDLWRREVVSFKAAYPNERIVANLLLPKRGSPPYPLVVHWPGSSALRTRSSEVLPNEHLDFLISSGRAVLMPILYGTYERVTNRTSSWPDPTRAFREWTMRQVHDVRRSLDYAETRQDLRRDRVGYTGYSWGSRLGPIVLAVDPRFAAAAFVAGGFSTASSAPDVDPLNFAPHVTVPTLMINGDADFIYPVETTQKPLFGLLGPRGDLKRHVVLPAGHVVLMEKRAEVIREILDWFDKHLGPAR